MSCAPNASTDSRENAFQVQRQPQPSRFKPGQELRRRGEEEKGRRIKKNCGGTNVVGQPDAAIQHSTFGQLAQFKAGVFRTEVCFFL